jgi:hypothetical protein
MRAYRASHKFQTQHKYIPLRSLIYLQINGDGILITTATLAIVATVHVIQWNSRGTKVYLDAYIKRGITIIPVQQWRRRCNNGRGNDGTSSLNNGDRGDGSSNSCGIVRVCRIIVRSSMWCSWISSRSKIKCLEVILGGGRGGGGRPGGASGMVGASGSGSRTVGASGRVSGMVGASGIGMYDAHHGCGNKSNSCFHICMRVSCGVIHNT